MSDSEPLVLVVVGTDYHPFDRLVGWVDDWLAEAGRDPVRCVLQYGSSRAPSAPGARPYLRHAELQQLMHDADIVITHGGPATIMECRRTGHLPIVVPRDSRLGEHVDEHQRRFTHRLAVEGMVVLCESKEELQTALRQALARPLDFRVATPHDTAAGQAAVPAPVQRAADLLDGLLSDDGAVVAGPTTAAAPADAAPPAAVLPVLYLGGFGRSGSTLLERLLGQLPGVCTLGEVVHLWERALRNDELCGCGERFHDCPFWHKVGEVAYGGWHNIDLQQVLALKQSVDRNRFIPQLAAPRLRPAMRDAVEKYVQLYERLYAAALQVSGASMVVDSSKHASLAFALRWSPRLQVRVLHVVRDSAGVAYSWGKRVPRPEVTGEEKYMPRYSPAGASALWSIHNALFELLAARGTPRHRLRYEDLLSDPATQVREVASFAGLPPKATAGLVRTLEESNGAIALASTHTVAGNPMRFVAGEVTLRRDDAWRTAMPARDQRIVRALSAPLRLRYGYRGGRHS